MEHPCESHPGENTGQQTSCIRNLLDTHSLINIYYAHIHSHLSYAITVWGSMSSKTQLNGLRKVQNQCIRIINKESTTSDITGQYEKLKVLTVDQLVKLHLCKLGHMISHKQLPTPIHNMFEAKGGKKHIAIQLGASISLTYNLTRLGSLIKVLCARV